MITTPYRVAVIEDDPINCWQLRRQLESNGCQVVGQFDSYLEAESMIAELFPDIIISNLKLSDGWVDDYYLNVLEGHSLHVIILTGLRDLTLHMPVGDRTLFHYLFKPYTYLQLASCLNEIDSDHSSPLQPASP